MKQLVLTDRATNSEYLIPANSGVIIGRDPEICNITTSDLKISKTHARITHETDGTVYLTDNKSRNGTFYNDERIYQRTQIFPPCDIFLSSHRFYLERRNTISEEKEKRRMGKQDTETDIHLP